MSNSKDLKAQAFSEIRRWSVESAGQLIRKSLLNHGQHAKLTFSEMNSRSWPRIIPNEQLKLISTAF
jgi:hypothetical protein